ncbi:MAG TPA: hypothetical protein VNJ08_11590 [Bacteriovoracaceae bacterium]|nr:hypothetical protein [Bacteriovoracaceae bacterium]
MKKLIAHALLLCISVDIHAGVVGDFSQVHNLPGHIDLNPESMAFEGSAVKNNRYDDGIITETPSELLSTFFNNGRVNTAKIYEVIREIKNYQENARIAYCQSEQAENNETQEGCNVGFPNPKLAKKWEKKNVNIAYNYSQQLFQEAIAHAPFITPENINSEMAQPFLEAFFDAYEIFQGVVQESNQVAKYSGIAKGMRITKDAFTPVVITKGRVEAANLLQQGNTGRVFYSPEELEQLKQSGTDISLLNPPDSGFWRNPKKSIKSYNTTSYNGQEIPFLQKDLNKQQIEDLMNSQAPINVEYEVETPKATGETPKINVKYNQTTYKIKFTTDRGGERPGTLLAEELMKVIRGAEVNTETVVNNLAAAIGYTVDATYYKDTVRVFFPNKIYEKGEFDKEYKKMYKILVARWDSTNNTGSALKVVKTDPETGRKYVELKHVQLERKSDVNSDMNIGSFIRKGLGKSLKREHRAFALFLAWVWDVDSKDYNDALKLVPYTQDGKLKYKVVMSNSDMGSALGSNRPNIYNFRLVKSVSKDSNGDPEVMNLNYLKVYNNDLLGATSFDDAKWLARLIGQLTEKQLYEAFRGAGYTELVSRYYVGIMLKKRNELFDALNMHSEFPKSPEFTGSIEGYEEFFHMGSLTDPDNKLWDKSIEPFPPYWGAGLNFNSDSPQAEFIKLTKIKMLTMAGGLVFNNLLTKTGYSNEGLRFSEILMPDSAAVPGCKGACFFQGINFGVEGFIPWRFILANPDLESKHPYLIVDLFRFGFFVGTKLQAEFGVDIPLETSLGIGASHYQVSEYIKVTPVDNLMDLFDNKGALITMPKLNFKTARATVIDTLKEDEYLIQSHYIGLKAKAKYTPFTWVLPIGPSVAFKGGLFAANRVTYMGKAKSRIMVGWDKIKQASANLRLNLMELIVIKIPVLEAEISKLHTVQRTFEFDRSNDAHREVLFNNVNRILPSGIPEEFSLAKRTTNLNERRFTMGFFNLIRRTSTRRSIRVDYEENAGDFVASNTNYVREIHKTRVNKTLGVHSTTYIIQASINSKNEIFAKIKLNGSFDNMNKYKFKHLLDKYSPILPENFIQFDPDAVLENFGNLLLNVETVLPERGLKQVFSKSVQKYGLCKVFSKVHNYDWTDEDCVYLGRIRNGLIRGLTGGKTRFLRLWSNYENVREIFWNISENRDHDDTKGINSKLKKIVTLLTDNGDYDYRIMNLFVAMSDKANYYRRASMTSKLEAFPGQTGTISEDVNAAGTYKPTPGMRTDRPEEEFSMFMDQIHNTIRYMFYNEHYANETLGV